ncbi:MULTISPECIES: GGDEF domain-containing protein [Micromonospora]|uniref:GGDEF domain-containing protein n=1 Tax=Micromonospora TaxID=1873 RepID=UPI001EE96879|nr:MULTISPECIES: GGDEF domain-containing protein [Micromonospora]MCG5453167.1 GGDEF domain-containing protein [Micromonospora hortensis]MCX5120711.1 GGDEF domain-containing protein [Micromonospora sp. NBC_00362]WTI07345.1 GGDEF domain-containing protein [Micromonospora sp. NBC_00821]
MGWLDRVDDQVDALTHARALQEASRSAEAYVLLERVIRTTNDPAARADAMVQRLSALINLGRTAEFTRAIEEASAAVRDLAEPYLHGHLNALAALAAHHQGALDRCVMHLVRAARALGAVADPDRDTAWGWHDLAMAYSYLSFHGYALGAIERARQLGLTSGIPEETFAAPGIRLRNAVALDHNGDSDGCLRVLRDVAADLTRFVRAGRAGQLRPSSLAAYGYAAARQAALGDQVAPEGPEPARLITHGGDSARARDLRQLGQVCLAVADGRPIEAVARLDTVQVSNETLGAAEPARLRSIALTRAGDHLAAHRADRLAFRLAAQRNDRLRDVYIDGIAARIDHEEMRREAARFEGEALTDPLTGLPNRRRLERYITAVVTRGDRVVIGVCDLDGFKAVNTRHGHHSGDLVLQRIAGVINRVMRRGDFVARYGGDEFVVVLPDTGMTEAAEVARRIEAAVRLEDWESLVPGTPVGVSIGFAEVSGGSGLRDALSVAFEQADREMLRAKTRPRAS